MPHWACLRPSRRWRHIETDCAGGDVQQARESRENHARRRSLDGRLSHQVRHQYPYCITLRKFWLAQESGNDETLLQAVDISKNAHMKDREERRRGGKEGV